MATVATLQHRAEYAMVALTRAVAARVPWASAAGLARCLTPAFRAVMAPYVREANRNLELSDLTCRDRRERSSLLQQVLVGSRTTYIELLRLLDMGPAEARDLLTLENEAAARRALSIDRGVIVVLGHTANWVLGASMLQPMAKRPVTIVTREQDNPLVEQLIARLWRRYELRAIDRRDAGASSVLVDALRRKEVVVLVLDQDGGPAGAAATLLGRPCSLPPGPAILALRTGAPLTFITLRRFEDGRQRAVIDEPIVVRREQQDVRTDIQVITQQLAGRLEQAIRRCPQQWNWLGNTWRTPPARQTHLDENDASDPGAGP